jgi:hypothetical protein
MSSSDNTDQPNENLFPVTPGTRSTRPSTTERNFSTLDDNELCVLATLAINTLKERGISHVLSAPSPPVKQPDIYENAKVEQIICSGLKPPYDGSPKNLLPTLNLINAHRKNEVWYPATFISQGSEEVDMILQFSKVDASTVLNNTAALWDKPTAATDSHTRGTPAYLSRLLGMFLLNSITNDLALLLLSRIDPKYSSDGPLLLYTMCSNIHCNHLAFVESIKNKIRTTTLSNINNDVQVFLRFLNDNLTLITSTGSNANEHKDLIPHILLQLCSTTIPIFQQSILQAQLCQSLPRYCRQLHRNQSPST